MLSSRVAARQAGSTEPGTGEVKPESNKKQRGRTPRDKGPKGLRAAYTGPGLSAMAAGKNLHSPRQTLQPIFLTRSLTRSRWNRHRSNKNKTERRPKDSPNLSPVMPSTHPQLTFRDGGHGKPSFSPRVGNGKSIPPHNPPTRVICIFQVCGSSLILSRGPPAFSGQTHRHERVLTSRWQPAAETCVVWRRDSSARGVREGGAVE